MTVRRLYLLVWCLSALSAAPLWAGPPDLTRYASRHYLIHTDLTKDEVKVFGRHMDAIFEQYRRRFASFERRGDARMPLYLFRQHQDYIDFLDDHGINARNSGGMFFVREHLQGLATWTQGRTRSQTFIVLQHEGFHQFAWRHLGENLPVWVNEGLAQYFEDAIIVGDRMKVGLANARRIELVRHAIRNGRCLDLDELVSVTEEDWGRTLNHDPERAAVLYAQSWSIVYYLVHGENGQQQDNFEQYLAMISGRYDNQRAFKAAFGVRQLMGLEDQWRGFALSHQPDPINTTASRLEFLGVALRFLQERGEPMPDSLDQLRENLQARRFRVTRSSHGLTQEVHASDNDLFGFPRGNGSTGRFLLLAPMRDDLPPRITAPGLSPEPTLVWSRDQEGQLVQEIAFR